LYLRGMCQAGSKQFAQAVQTLRGLLSEDASYPSADRVLYELAWTLQDMGSHDEALATFSKLPEQYPKSPLAAECLFRVAEAHFDKQNYAQALPFYKKAVEQSVPGDLREKALHKLGWTQFHQDDFAAARAAFDTQCTQFPTGPLAVDGLQMLAECHYQQKNYPAALAAFQKARDAGPASPQLDALGLLHAAQSASRLEKWDQSLALLEQTSKQHPDSPYQDEVLFEQGLVKQNQGMLEEAEKLYRQVTERNQQQLGARAHFMMGEIRFQQGDHEEAVRSFFKVAYGYGDRQAPESFHPWQAKAMFEAARSLERLGKRDAARRVFAELIERFPDSQQVPQARAKLQALGS